MYGLRQVVCAGSHNLEAKGGRGRAATEFSNLVGSQEASALRTCVSDED